MKNYVAKKVMVFKGENIKWLHCVEVKDISLKMFLIFYIVKYQYFCYLQNTVLMEIGKF